MTRIEALKKAIQVLGEHEPYEVGELEDPSCAAYQKDTEDAYDKIVKMVAELESSESA